MNVKSEPQYELMSCLEGILVSREVMWLWALSAFIEC